MPIPQLLAMTGVIPMLLLRREAMLPRENISVPNTAQPIPLSVAASKLTTRSVQKISTRPVAPTPPARSVFRVIRSPKNSRALIALKIDANEKTIDTSPDGINAEALYRPIKLKQNRQSA